MDPDVTPKPKKPKVSLDKILIPLQKLPTALKTLSTPFKSLPGPLKTLPIPKKFLIPAIAVMVLLTAGGAVAFLHAGAKHGAGPAGKAVASAPLASATTAPADACSGVERDIYRQTVDEDPSVTLADVRSEVLSSGVSCVPDPEIAPELSDLSPPCRDMVQYTFLSVRGAHADIKVNDVRERVVEKSAACERDRQQNTASVARNKPR